MVFLHPTFLQPVPFLSESPAMPWAWNSAPQVFQTFQMDPVFQRPSCWFRSKPVFFFSNTHYQVPPSVYNLCVFN